MQPNDIIVLQAFQTSLSQLEEPLPAHIQTQLNEIGENLKANPNNIGNLDTIAENYPPLDAVYQKTLTTLRQEAGERSKGEKPPSLSNQPTPEITNTVINTFTANDSVAAAKEETKPNLLQRIKKSLKGDN
ncbi:MAG: hypothetical protein WA919_04705 [Coleofasciculaceae cyanobacterium]